MLKNAVTKASLLAEVSTLEEFQKIAHEELRLSQRKKRLALAMELAKIEAKKSLHRFRHGNQITRRGLSAN